MLEGTPTRSDAANFFETELTQDMIATATEAVVLTTNGAPSSPCYLVIDPDDPLKREVIYFDGEFDGTTFVTTSLANRYLDGSASESILHETGAKVISAPVAQMLRDMHARIDNSPPIGSILFWSGSIETIPDGWALCDGTNGTPDLRGLFIVGAGGSYAVGATGGANTVTLTTSQIPSHSHSINSHSHTVNNHNHGGSTSSAGSHSHSAGTYSASNAGGHSHALSTVTATSASGHTHPASGNTLAAGPSTDVSAPDRTTANAGAHTHSISGSSATGGSHSHTIPTQTGLATGGSGSLMSNTTGGGQAHENRPPFYALAMIQRIA